MHKHNYTWKMIWTIRLSALRRWRVYQLMNSVQYSVTLAARTVHVTNRTYVDQLLFRAVHAKEGGIVISLLQGEEE
jgi:hypothetical protein